MPATDSSPVAWSPAQLVRLESEWRKLRRSFAFHPAVRVVPVEGDPPGEYRVEYKLRTLALDADGPLAYIEACAVHIWLPPQFPHAAPVLRPMLAIFHPNVLPDAIQLTLPWNPATGSLVNVVTRCGELLAYQVYDPAMVLNATGMEWVTRYPHLVPTDPNAVFTADAGGDGLARIVRSGAQAVEQYRAQLTEMSLGILESRPSTGRLEVQRFGSEISLLLSVFSEADVPEHLRSLAAELDSWARSMTKGQSIWDELRAFYSHTRSAVAASHRVREARDSLDAALVSVADLVLAKPSSDPLETLARMPVVTKLDPPAIRLRSALREAEKHIGALRAVVEGISAAPPAPVGTRGGLLHERTTADVARGLLQAAAAREEALAALAAVEPVLTRSQVESAALDSLVAWASFTDLVRRGNELTQRLVDLGAAGIQAYFLHTPAGKFGPYQFEERVDLDAARLVTRRIGAGPMEVYEARSVALLGKGLGSVRVRLADKDGALQEIEVQATEHAEELRIQLDYLLKTSREQVLLLRESPGTDASSSSWMARFSAALAGPEAVQAVTEVHRRASHRWAALAADLDELARFKERVATYHLLERHFEFVPAVLEVRAKAEASLAQANERLGFIAARSSRDVETNQLVVAAQFASENAECMKQRQRAGKDLAKVRKLLSLVVAELQARLADKRPLGKPGVPKLRLFAVPDGYAMLSELSTNERLQSRVVELERLLGTRLLAAKPLTQGDVTRNSGPTRD